LQETFQCRYLEIGWATRPIGSGRPADTAPTS